MILQTRLHTVTLHSHRSRRIVRPAYWPTCIRLLPCLFLTACGGGNTVTSPPPPTTTIRTFESGSLVYLEADTGDRKEHTSELQSRLHLVCRLLLEKKKKTEKQATSGGLKREERRLNGSSY